MIANFFFWKKVQKMAPHTTLKNEAPQVIAYFGLSGNTALAEIEFYIFFHGKQNFTLIVFT